MLRDSDVFWNMLPFCVYVLFSPRDNMLYHGFTTNLQARLRDHAAGKTKSTAARRPLRLIHAEFFISRNDAQRRERYFKTNQGKRMLKLMLSETFEELQH
jgi:putative endonuclease